MKRLESIAAAVAMVLLSASAGAAQEPSKRPAPAVDCDSICLIFPSQAPAECACGILTGGTSTGSAGSGGSPADPAAAAVVDEMQASYRDALAGIDDYTTIQASWSQGVLLGPPAPVYYEVEDVGGEPVPRQVPQDELARREAVKTGQPTPEQTLEGLAAAFRILGEGVPEGYTPTDEGEATFIEFFNAVAATGIAQNAAHELDKALGEMAQADQDNLLEKLMDMRELGQRLRLTMARPCEEFSRDDILEQVGLGGLLCMVLVANADDLAGLDLGAGWDDHELVEVEIVVAGKPTLPAGFEELYTCTDDCSQIEDQVRSSVDVLPLPFSSLFLLKNGNGSHVQIQQSATAAEVADSRTRFIPRRTRSKILGLRGVQDVAGEVLKVIVNEGPLSQERLAQELHEAMQKVTNN